MKSAKTIHLEAQLDSMLIQVSAMQSELDKLLETGRQVIDSLQKIDASLELSRPEARPYPYEDRY